jgi:hypothetical protein
MNRLRRHGGWQYDPGCPCDEDFVDWCETQDVRSQVIFHLGCGMHHKVGRALATPARNNQVLSLTANREELDSYADAVLENPALAARYRVLFGDLFDLEARVLPFFDAATLFHLCEAQDDARPDLIPAVRSVVQTFLERLTPAGHLFFYAGSTGAAETTVVLRSLEAVGRIAPAGAHRSLRLYRAAPGTGPRA